MVKKVGSQHTLANNEAAQQAIYQNQAENLVGKIFQTHGHQETDVINHQNMPKKTNSSMHNRPGSNKNTR